MILTDIEVKIMPRTGRPRSFDRDLAVTAAMHLFWRDGFEGVSVEQLRREMGKISPASFYAAFGSKEALYSEALKAYLELYGVVPNELQNAERSPRKRIEAAFRGFAAMQKRPVHPTGCMVTLSATIGSRTSNPAQELTAKERAATRAAISACIADGVRCGELRPDADAVGLATLFEGLLLGLSIQARDGLSAAWLDAAVSHALGVWDSNASLSSS